MNLAIGALRTLSFVLSCLLFTTGAASIDAPKPVAANVKQSLEAKLLSGMHITTLKLDDKLANINGVSPSNALVSQFLRNLANSPSYTKVELVSIERRNNAIEFHIVAAVQCPSSGNNTYIENLCDKSAINHTSVFKCTQNGKTVFQDRPCVKVK